MLPLPEKVRDGERPPGKDAAYATCYMNFDESSVGHDLLAVLEEEACRGMPLLGEAGATPHPRPPSIGAFT